MLCVCHISYFYLFFSIPEYELDKHHVGLMQIRISTALAHLPALSMKKSVVSLATQKEFNSPATSLSSYKNVVEHFARVVTITTNRLKTAKIIHTITTKCLVEFPHGLNTLQSN